MTVASLNKYYQKNLTNRVANGLCIRCAKPLQNYKHRCDKCTNDIEKARQERVASRRAAGVCYYCGAERWGNGTRCFKHWLYHSSWNILKHKDPMILAELWEEQNGICGLTGQPLTPDNAQVDHIIPRSRGGDNSKSNLRWVTRTANLVKGELLDHELAEHCRLILGFF